MFDGGDREESAEMDSSARFARLARDIAVLSYRGLIPAPFTLVFRSQLVPFRLFGGFRFGIGGNFFPRKLFGDENRVMRRH
jgi:hypothetical protein